jgi:pilus assembly protein CpaC
MKVQLAIAPGFVTRARPRVAWGALAFAMLLMCAGAAAAASGDRPEQLAIAIKLGETYLIQGVDPSNRPEIHTISNPQALIVNQRADGAVLVLGADPGVQSVQIVTTDGRIENYIFTVHSVTDPNHPLAAVAAPAAVSEALDDGAGPVVDRGGSAIVSSAANSPANATVQSPPPVLENPALSAPLRTQVTPREYTANPPAIASPADDVSHGAGGGLPDDAITLRFGTSRLFKFEHRIRRISIADSEVADVEVIDPHQLMLIGLKPGFTTLAVWNDQGRYTDCQVRVAQSGREQVMLNVTVAELDRTKIENQGIDLSAALTHYGVSLVGLPGQVASTYSNASTLTSGSTVGGVLGSGGTLIPLLLSSNLTYALAAQNSNIQTQSFFRFLESNSLARILAQPQLVANSGEEAKFLSGGEIPIVIAQALTTSIVFKQFGTSVTFVPTVIGKRDLELVVKPEVSKPDPADGVSLFGFTVPAFLTQRAETVVQMRDNQTLIIAGLIERDRSATVNKVPYLGDLPYLGALFRNTTFQDEKTELVMSVTPTIVRPIPDGGQVAYPQGADMTSAALRTVPVNPPDASRPRF